jgi:hypothetical protein
MRPNNTARADVIRQRAAEMTKELFAKPAMTINDLYDDPNVQSRIGNIINLSIFRKRSEKLRTVNPRKRAVAPDYDLRSGNPVGHYEFYGRRA